MSRSSATISRVVNARPGTPGGWLHADELAGGHALRELVLDRVDRHLAHRPPERVSQEGPFVDDRLAFEVPVLGERDGGRAP